MWYSNDIITMNVTSEWNAIYINSLDFGSSHENNKTQGISQGKLFRGEITHLNIWSAVKRVDELIKITQNCNEDYGNIDILDWSKITKSQFMNIKNGVNIKVLKNIGCDYWNDTKKKVKIIPHLIDNNMGNILCKIMAAEMYIPETKEELLKLYNVKKQENVKLEQHMNNTKNRKNRK